MTLDKFNTLNIVVGGDDQSICSLAINTLDLSIKEIFKFKNGHMASVKDIWKDDMYMFSIGCDQRLIHWKMSDYVKFEELNCAFTEVPETSALDVVIINDIYYIVTGGRGLHLLKYTKM